MTVVQLRELARANKVRLPYGVNKAQMVETLFRQLGSGAKEEPAEKPEIGLYKPKPFGFYDEEYGTSNPVVPQMLKAGLLGSGRGLLEVQPGGYGFLRTQNGTPGADDIYVSIAQIRRFNLHSGDEIIGKTRPKRLGDRYNALMYIESVNGDHPEIARIRRPFEQANAIGIQQSPSAQPRQRVGIRVRHPIRRIQKHQIKAHLRHCVDRGAVIRPNDLRPLVQRVFEHAFRVSLNRPNRLAVAVHDHRVRRAPAQRLQRQRAGAAEQIQHVCPIQARAQNVEQGLARAIRRRTRIHALRRKQPSTASVAADDSQVASLRKNYTMLLQHLQ